MSRHNGKQVETVFGENMRITCAANQGGRDYMEDRIHVESVRHPDGRLNYLFVAIYDGHGGQEASAFAKEHLLTNIQEDPNFESEDDEKFLSAITNGFLQTHTAMEDVVGDWKKTASGYPSTAGTTASVAFIRRGKIYMGHVGDSAIILGKRTREFDKDGNLETRMRAVGMTIDHKPDLYSERNRIMESGGTVAIKQNCLRVVWERKPHAKGPEMVYVNGRLELYEEELPMQRVPFLAVTRSLGDLWSWNQRTGQYIVSPKPDVSVYTLDPDEDVCLIVASDGLTGAMNPIHAVVLSDMCERFSLENTDYDIKRRATEGIHTNTSRVILQHALPMWEWKNPRADNISIITVIFDHEEAMKPPRVLEKLNPAAVSLEEVFTEYRDDMVAVGPYTEERLPTIYTPVLYGGNQDFPGSACYSPYEGPGFRTHESEALREEEFREQVDIPTTRLLSVEEITIMAQERRAYSRAGPLFDGYVNVYSEEDLDLENDSFTNENHLGNGESLEAMTTIEDTENKPSFVEDEDEDEPSPSMRVTRSATRRSHQPLETEPPKKETTPKKPKGEGKRGRPKRLLQNNVDQENIPEREGTPKDPQASSSQVVTRSKSRENLVMKTPEKPAHLSTPVRLSSRKRKALDFDEEGSTSITPLFGSFNMGKRGIHRQIEYQDPEDLIGSNGSSLGFSTHRPHFSLHSHTTTIPTSRFELKRTGVVSSAPPIEETESVMENGDPSSHPPPPKRSKIWGFIKRIVGM